MGLYVNLALAPSPTLTPAVPPGLLHVLQPHTAIRIPSQASTRALSSASYILPLDSYVAILLPSGLCSKVYMVLHGPALPTLAKTAAPLRSCICNKDLLDCVEERREHRDFPGGAVDKTPCSQCRGPGFNPWSGN